MPPQTVGVVGLVGLGLMGSAIAERLMEAGLTVHGHTRRREGRRAHEARGGIAHDRVGTLLRHCHVVVLSLPDGDASRDVAAGLLAQAAHGTVVVDTTTVDPDEAETLAARAASAGVQWYDAGLSGSSAAVRRSSVLAVVGGPAGGFEQVRTVLGAFCPRVVLMGGPGAGMRTKLVINHVHALNRLALAEGLVFAERLGMDLEQVLDVLRSSAASSRAAETWGPRMVAGEHGDPQSRIRTGLKDARLIAASGKRHGAPMPALAEYVVLLEQAIAGGLADQDNSALIAVLRQAAADLAT